MQKSVRYEAVFSELSATLSDVSEPKERKSLLCKVLSAHFGEFNFVGFYDVSEAKENTLVIGPYTSATVIPCGEIAFGKGVCGTCAQLGKVQVENDVKALANYIACDAETASEIVLPVYDPEHGGGKLLTVLDIDATAKDAFEEDDVNGLERVVSLIGSTRR